MPFDGTWGDGLHHDLYRARRLRACNFIIGLPVQQFEMRWWGDPNLLKRRSRMFLMLRGGAIGPRWSGCALGWMAAENFDGWHWNRSTRMPMSPHNIPTFRGAAEYFGCTLADAHDIFDPVLYPRPIAQTTVCGKLASHSIVVTRPLEMAH